MLKKKERKICRFNVQNWDQKAIEIMKCGMVLSVSKMQPNTRDKKKKPQRGILVISNPRLSSA